MHKSKLSLFINFCLCFVIGVSVGAFFVKDSHEDDLRRMLLTGDFFTGYLLDIERSNSFSTDQKHVPCPKDDYLGVITFGQSNVTNTIVRKAAVQYIDDKTYMYDWASGHCYPFSEPLVGTDGLNGNILSDTVTKMRAAGFDKNIVFAPLGRSGSSIFSWMMGIHKKRLDYFTALAKKNGVEFDVWFWQQGETDGEPEFYVAHKRIFFGDESGSVEMFYTRALEFLYDYIKAYNPDAKLGVSLTSVCDNRGSGSIRAAQQGFIDRHEDVFFSTDTDTLDHTYRRDKCHFNTKGADAVGQDYADILMRLADEIP